MHKGSAQRELDVWRQWRLEKLRITQPNLWICGYSSDSNGRRFQVKTTCLINNYNYGQYVTEAIDSALKQTIAFDEIIVVDDGSEDGSQKLISDRYANTRVVRLICQENGGQLSCFNEGFAASTGDLIFFLDADDIYETSRVQAALEVYERLPETDFTFCALNTFGLEETYHDTVGVDHDHGFTVMTTLFRSAWVGAPTSTLCARRKLLRKILPIPHLYDWMVRADDCLVYGASLAGGRKYYESQASTRYRVHGENRYYNTGIDDNPVAAYRRMLAIDRLFSFFLSKLGHDRESLAALAVDEFLTIEQPTSAQLRDYTKVVQHSNLRDKLKRRSIASLKKHHRQGQRR
jgi:glycosyltransferase involved in cell wall biosynthesis